MPIVIDPIAGITFPDNSIATTGTLAANGGFQLPAGTTAQRPSSPVAGMIRFNTTTSGLEVYNSNTSSWTGL